MSEKEPSILLGFYVSTDMVRKKAYVVEMRGQPLMDSMHLVVVPEFVPSTFMKVFIVSTIHYRRQHHHRHRHHRNDS